ncbi:MAG: ABC transporter ATP-binding protein [Deltaproteobacteria bacterium]|nr:MAG: ABC transporter ATP-binding protein [Deltaproteobacteria bacterium]
MREPILQTQSLTKSFGALVALSDINLSVTRGEIHTIVGPNGAGKTTFFNLVTGKLKPSAGRILFRGEDITGLSVHRISRLGLARSFQITNVMLKLTVFENIRLAVQSRSNVNFHFFASPQKLIDINSKALEIIEKVNLLDDYDKTAESLSHGALRQLEIGMALACDPHLMLLDEPTAGMGVAETQETMQLIREIAQNMTILLIEHDMDVVFSISDTISVFHYGHLLVTDTPQKIRENEEVQNAYLGRKMGVTS